MICNLFKCIAIIEMRENGVKSTGNHPLALQFDIQRLQMEKKLSSRNGTIMAHGYESVQFLALAKKDLPVFPQMQWGYQGLS